MRVALMIEGQEGVTWAQWCALAGACEEHGVETLFRSDHYNYAKKGIPIIFFFDGVHEDYHQAGDEAQKIDYDKMEKVTRTIYMTLWEVANLPVRPKVDKPLPAQLNQQRGG